MNSLDNIKFVCPISKDDLEILEKKSTSNDMILEGTFVCPDNQLKYSIINGIPNFTSFNEKENDKNEYALKLFKEKARQYDKYQHLSFETFYKNESEVRNDIIDRLHLKDNSVVLEVNAGTGRDSKLILERLSTKGEMHVQDISRDMLEVCKEKIENTPVPLFMHQGDACKLPYKDGTFDAVYSFGGVGMNTYSNNKDAIAELVRVTKVGGRVVFGGLSLAPWLKDSFFGKVLVNHNEHYANEISFKDFPIEARELRVSWILEGAGFVIDFTVGEGEPKANFEYEIPGVRGGTHLTRYLGNLEGVTAETKELAQKARATLGISMHQWLDSLIKQEATKILNDKTE